MVGVGVNVDSQSEFDIVSLVLVDSSAVDLLHDGLHIGVRHVEGKTAQLETGKEKSV